MTATIPTSEQDLQNTSASEKPHERINAFSSSSDMGKYTISVDCEIDLNTKIPGTEIIPIKIEMNDNKQFIIYEENN